jgi:hypothetical protein
MEGMGPRKLLIFLQDLIFLLKKVKVFLQVPSSPRFLNSRLKAGILPEVFPG